uniref:Uncharacterized protein n=1 Tax=Phytophthora fragariae TaxID=53985 RepID=A0A6A3FMK0_9STRA|nr:hypothetical protein PF009_g4802 [Phytophthora fragariae]
MARFDVGHPNAFVQPVGEQCDQWAYRLVTGGVNVTVLNALELLDRQNDVIAACGKSRSGLPASVLSTMVSVEFAPDENVPLIRPDTLEIVFVRRQHIVDCELDGRNTNPANVFKDPILSESPAPVTRPNVGAANSITNNFGLACSDSEDETKDNDTSTVQANISLVRLQNRSLRKRTREADAVDDDLFLPDDTDLPVFPTSGYAHASSFRPSQMKKQVHDAISHPSLIGKNAQAVLESAQQGSRTKFLATRPVLRLSYDLSFGIRGLSLMHFQRFIQELEQNTSSATGSMTNFGRSNALQPATAPTSINEIVDAFNTLLLFAEGFYNSTVYNFIKTGAVFMMRFAVLSRPDAATCNRLVFWINSKLGKFRSQIIAANIQTAALVGLEFTRNDDHLLELYQAQQDRQRIAQLSIKSTRTPGSTRPSSTRDPRMTKVSSVPRELLAMLPKQGNKTMCMRFLSKKGCTGPAPGQCSDPNRAHFKPLALPADAKTFIDKTFLGLGPDFQDL